MLLSFFFLLLLLLPQLLLLCDLDYILIVVDNGFDVAVVLSLRLGSELMTQLYN